jgi:hypothetical protein
VKPVLPLLLLAACADDPSVAGPGIAEEDAAPAPAVAHYVVDALDFVVVADGVLGGFDLDGLSDDCDVPDGTGPGGEGGVDNQFGSVLPSMPEAVSSTLPAAIDDAIASGRMMLLFEVDGPLDLAWDGAAAVRLLQGDGDVMVGTDGEILPGQTVGLAAEDTVFGATDAASVVDGALTAGPFAFEIRLDFLGTPVRVPLERGLVRATPDGEGGLDLLFGGVIPLDAVMAIVGGLGGDDTELRIILEGLVPLLVDARTAADGDCDGISGALAAHAVPVYLYDSSSLGTSRAR